MDVMFVELEEVPSSILGKALLFVISKGKDLNKKTVTTVTGIPLFVVLTYKNPQCWDLNR